MLKRQFSEDRPEMMDRADADPEILEEDLRNLRTINRFFGGLRALRTGVMMLAKGSGNGHPLSILDLATGSGDQPIALVREFRKSGREVKILAIDRNDVMLNIARRRATGMDEISFDRQDITSLPYEGKSFDIVTCSLAIHHFSRDNGVQLLREMERISRLGFVVNDLSRSYLGAATAWFYTRLTTINPMTRYDSVVSVLRAFTKRELSEMLREAGVHNAQIFTMPFFRLVAVIAK